jgi:hypothetical protein
VRTYTDAMTYSLRLGASRARYNVAPVFQDSTIQTLCTCLRVKSNITVSLNIIIFSSIGSPNVFVVAALSYCESQICLIHS